MREASPASPIYGFQTWLNRPNPGADGPHPLFPDAAADTVFAAIGHMGQYIVVSPEQKLTLVRFGHSDDEGARGAAPADGGGVGALSGGLIGQAEPPPRPR